MEKVDSMGVAEQDMTLNELAVLQLKCYEILLCAYKINFHVVKNQ